MGGIILILVTELEDELKLMTKISPCVENIMEFCKQFSGKEKFLNLYNQYSSNNRVSYQYFKDIVTGNFTSYKVGKELIIDFDVEMV